MVIVGLGNPGLKYKKTRHNVGFMFIDEVAKSNQVTFSLNKNLQCEIAEIYINKEKHFLIKPTTFMNLSGDSVYKVLNYYNIDKDDLIVIYDDMDLNVGQIRIRKNGSAGGHNGMKSIINNLNSQDFKRIRIGIGKPEYNSIDFVLGQFSKNEEEMIRKAIELAPNIIDDFIIRGVDYIMNHYNM